MNEIDTESPMPPIREFEVEAVIKFTVHSPGSVVGAYREFTQFITNVFNKAWSECPENGKPPIVPCHFDVVRVEKKERI